MASRSRRLKASIARFTVSTFSCDTAHRVSRCEPMRDLRLLRNDLRPFAEACGCPLTDWQAEALALDRARDDRPMADGRPALGVP